MADKGSYFFYGNGGRSTDFNGNEQIFSRKY
jgi:hypothetical protein